MNLRARLSGVVALAGVLFGAACDPDALDPEDESVAAPGDEEVAPDAHPVGELFTSEVDPSAKNTITNCYCGLYNGSPLYVGVECVGYPSTQVCCSEKCSELIAALNGQL